MYPLFVPKLILIVSVPEVCKKGNEFRALDLMHNQLLLIYEI